MQHLLASTVLSTIAEWAYIAAMSTAILIMVARIGWLISRARIVPTARLDLALRLSGAAGLILLAGAALVFSLGPLIGHPLTPVGSLVVNLVAVVGVIALLTSLMSGRI